MVGAAAGAATHVASAAADDPRRAVAVLEFRNDSSALDSIGSKFAAVLNHRTSLRVLDDTQTRQRYGSKLDAAIVACDGDARCIGAIGRELGVAEVLLIGVSELGDVILTVQRIDSGTGRVLDRLAEALASDAAPLDSEVVGYLERVLPAEDFVQMGTISITVNVAGAEIVVGGRRRGVSPLASLRVAAPSSYDLDVKKVGYHPFHAEVRVPPDSEIKVNAQLTGLNQDNRGPWYTKGWVVAAAGVLVTGAVTAGFLLSRDRDHVTASGHFE
jgi:hypothetical protein